MVGVQEPKAEDLMNDDDDDDDDDE